MDLSVCKTKTCKREIQETQNQVIYEIRKERKLVSESCVIRKRGKRETVSGYNQVEFVGLYNDEMKMGVDYGFQNEYFGFGKTSNGYFYVD